MSKKLTDDEKNLLENQIKKDLNKSSRENNTNISPIVYETIDFNLIPDDELVSSEENIQYKQNNLSLKDFNKLKSGDMIITTLDLHGIRAHESQAMIIKFIENSLANGVNKVKIIHGKSINNRQNNPPIIKNITHQLLQKLPQVLAFCSAKQYDGGTGSVYVLLKSKRR